MIHNPLARTGDNQVGQTMQSSEALENFRLLCQNFTQKLNSQPNPESIGKTPDGRAQTVTISHVEMTLDEYFFGLWETENFKWATIANEIVGSIELAVVHPVYGQKIRRAGAAAIQIMMDAAPDQVKNDKQAKNQWALNPQNKKPNALDMGFPKLKAECLKNAAQSLGQLFGRDLNRTNRDNFNGLLSSVSFEDVQQLFELKKEFLSPDDLANIGRIIERKEATSYNKVFKYLQSI